MMKGKKNQELIRIMESNQSTLWPQFKTTKIEAIDKSVDNQFNKCEKCG
jgi:hypothetical protein